MTDNLSSDLNEFIHNAALNKESVDDSYKTFCGIHPNQKINYVDFEWKHYQFYLGSPNFTMKRSPLTIAHLPVDVLEKVFEKLSLVDRLVLRKVSKDMRNLVDSSEVCCENINFTFGYTTLKIEFGKLKLCYEEMADGSWSILSSRLDTKIKKVKENRNFKHAMIVDASTFLRNPKLRIGHIEFNVYDDVDTAEFLGFLKSLNFQLNVRSIQSANFKFILALLPFLKSEKVEEIKFAMGGFNLGQLIAISKSDGSAIVKNPRLKIGHIMLDDYNNESSAKFSQFFKSLDFQHNLRSFHIRDDRWIDLVVQFFNPEQIKVIVIEGIDFTVKRFNEIAGMEQWKRKIKLRWGDIHGVGVEQVLNFKEFLSTRFALTDENLIKIRDNLHKSPNLKFLRLEEFCNEEEMEKRVDGIMSQNPAYDAQNRRFSIPNSSDYFQLEFGNKLHRIILTIGRVSAN